VRGGDTRAPVWLALFLVSTLSATEVATSANLMDLYALAQTSDPTYQSARHALDAAKQKRPEAFSALLPALTASAADGRTQGRTRYTDTPEIDRTFNTDQWTLQLTQPVFRADRLLAYGEARATVEQALAQFDAARQDLMLRLSRAYFDEIVAERHVAAARAQLVALTEQLQAARRSFESGVASITDVDDTRSRAASAQAQETGALNDLESARAALEAIIGAPPEKLAPLRAEAALPKPFPSDAASWVQRAIEDNPSVKAAAAVAKAADYEVDRSRAQRLPSVDLIATYGGNYAGGNITDPINYDTIVRDKQINLQVTMPLLDGGGMHAQVAEARAQRARTQSDLIAARRQAALDARQSFAAALSGASQVEALETAVSAGQSALKGNRVGYGLGIRINSDVLNAEQQLYGTLQDLAKAQYDTLYAGLKLKAATGQLAEEDLRGVNALLEESR
jgi:outer membrane protein